MNKKIWRLCVQDEFAAAHALRYYQGKCEAIHGHNFKVELCVQGEKLSTDTEILLDFSIIKKELKKVLDELDHKNLNNIEPFLQKNPSSENIAAFIYTVLKKILSTYSTEIYSVSVSERTVQKATYMELSYEQSPEL